MIIYFEGLSCAGKSTLINYLQESSEFVLAIPELPLKLLNHKKITTSFCRLNDQRKCLKAKESDQENRLTLVDRGYLSTIVYSYIQYQNKEDNEYLENLTWYMKNIHNGKLKKPHVYVYIYIDKETALQRSKQLNRFTKKFAWYIDPQSAIDCYSYFFKYIEPDVPLILIDGTQDIVTQSKAFWKGINKLKHG